MSIILAEGLASPLKNFYLGNMAGLHFAENIGHRPKQESVES